MRRFFFVLALIGLLCVLAVPAFAQASAQTGHFTKLFTEPSNVLDAGVILNQANCQVGDVWLKYSWGNSDIVALGANTTANIKLCTLPPNCIVKRAFIVVTSACAGTGVPSTLTVSMGKTATDYLDYVQAGSAKAAATYGDAIAEVGTALSEDSAAAWGEDLVTAATPVYLQFVASGANLDKVLACEGTVYMEVEILP